MWGHCDTAHRDWMHTARLRWPDMFQFLVVRNPIHTLCTHYGDASSRNPHRRIKKCYKVRNELDLYLRIQEDYIIEHKPYIHKVEDSIVSLGIWLGADLQKGGARHSRPNDLREAVDARDADRCFRTIGYSDLWEWFTTTHSRNLAPLYRDQLGYDFWWYNG